MGRWVDRLLNISLGETIVVLAALLVSFGGGFLSGGHYFNELATFHRQLVKDFDGLSKKFNAQEHRQLTLQLGAEVDRQALEKMRRTVVVLDRELSGYQEELDLYRNLVKSDQLDKGLQISNFLIRSTETLGIYRYRFALRKTEGLAKTTKVSFSVKLEGEIDDQPVVYTLAQLDPDVEAMPVNTKVKYFQLVEGIMHLPDGFKPRAVSAEIWPSDKKTRSRKIVIAWDLARGQLKNRGG